MGTHKSCIDLCGQVARVKGAASLVGVSGGKAPQKKKCLVMNETWGAKVDALVAF